jgi:predicted anti-sigma-YlaC factor YlaD
MATACEAFEQDLVLYHYGELSGADRDPIAAHLENCAACAHYLNELGTLLPLTVKSDEPPQAFWDDYSRAMRRKLTEANERKSWWASFSSLVQPWAIPALATMTVVALALTFTLGKGFWRTKEAPQDDEAFIEALPVAENLEFFRTMDVLDDMDLLEFMGSQGNGAA